MRTVFTAALLVAFATAAQAYVPPTDKLVAAWTQTYEKAPPFLIAGTLEQGATSQPFRAWSSPKGVVFEVAGRPVSDPTAVLALGLLLAPAKTYPVLLEVGLDTAKDGLARFEGKIAYTIGSVGEKQPGTQLWLDRQTFAPALVLIERNGKPAGRIDFTGYSASPSRLVPTEIRLDVDGLRLLRIENLTTLKR